jgi:hypothetical protein
MASLPSKSTRFPGESCNNTFKFGNKLLLRLAENFHGSLPSHIAFGKKLKQRLNKNARPKEEFYRCVIVPYEDKKREENRDVQNLSERRSIVSVGAKERFSKINTKQLRQTIIIQLGGPKWKLCYRELPFDQL